MSEEKPLLDKKGTFKRCWTYSAVCLGATELGVAVTSLVILGVNGSDCQKPVRLWLEVLFWLLGLHGVFLVTCELLCTKLRQRLEGCYIGVNSLVVALVFMWMLIGTVWVFYDTEECEKSFEEGYLFSLVVLCIFYGLISNLLVLFLVLTCVTCWGSLKIDKFVKG